jgi:hypothetical protein
MVLNLYLIYINYLKKAKNLFIILLFIELIIKGCINNMNNKGYIKKNNNITIIKILLFIII